MRDDRMRDAAYDDTAGSREALDSLRLLFENQVRAYEREGGLAYRARREALRALERALAENRGALVKAVAADYGRRPAHETLLAEIYLTRSNLSYTLRRLRRWMRPARRSVELPFLPSRARVVPQPLGVVGIISPWNYPIYLACVPMIAALAAGNRVLLKPSELTPATSAVLETLVRSAFDPAVAAVAAGGPPVAAAFCALPFHHILFTGSTGVGRSVMRAAAENLTPVTLELGGKSPAILGPEYPLADFAGKIMAGKLLNAGQTCIAPDYLLVPRESTPRVIDALKAACARMVPPRAGDGNYAAVINAHHYQRLCAFVEDARAKGAVVIALREADGGDDPARRTLAPKALCHVTDAMRLMQEEIFGPLLPIVEYDDLEAAIAYVNARPRPLALYYFDTHRARIRTVLERTVSGGCCINGVISHVAQNALPFGGVGASGMGAYHGREGFETFSHMKAVLYQSRFAPAALLRPPYRGIAGRLLRMLAGPEAMAED